MAPSRLGHSRIMGKPIGCARWLDFMESSGRWMGRCLRSQKRQQVGAPHQITLLRRRHAGLSRHQQLSHAQLLRSIGGHDAVRCAVGHCRAHTSLPGVAPQVGQRTESICCGVSSHSGETISQTLRRGRHANAFWRLGNIGDGCPRYGKARSLLYPTAA
jgi:hypothetical protein